MKNNRLGFTFLEVLIAIAIMGILLRYAMPNLQRSKPRYERQQFVARLNALMQLAWQRALVTHKIQRIAFDIGAMRISLAEQADEVERDGDQKFVTSKGAYIRTSFAIDNNIDIKHFLIEGFDEMGRFAGGRKTTEMWFFIVPEGLAQEVVITFVDQNDRVENKARMFRLILNPFNAQFTLAEL